MSMSTHVVGIKPPDQKWRQMKAIWDACKAAKVEIPNEVWEFFDDADPDDSGVLVDLDKNVCVQEWHDESSAGLEIDLQSIPKDVKILRFYNSW